MIVMKSGELREILDVEAVGILGMLVITQVRDDEILIGMDYPSISRL
jgi:hypothetical protein